MQTQRPWAMSIQSTVRTAKQAVISGIFKSAPSDQVNKLARNYIVSLDIGCNNMRLVNEVDHNIKMGEATDRDKYLQWVKNWKLFYLELSELIRTYKQHKRRGEELNRLKETAQVMLNARYTAKLASWALVQKRFRRTNQT